MMITDKLKSICTCLLLFGFGSTACAQYSNLQTAEEVNMKTGIPVKYSYDPQRTRLRDSDSIEVALIISFGNGFASKNLKAVRNGKLWETEFILPDSAAALALRFRDGDITDDNHGKGYVYPIYKQGAPVREAWVSVAAMMIHCKRVLSLGPAYASNALAIFEREFEKVPSLKQEKALDYYNAMAYAKKKEVSPLLEKKADSLLAAGFSEKGWSLAADLLQLAGKRAASDSLKDVIEERTKGGNRIGAAFWQHFLSLQSADSMLAILQKQMKLQPPPDEKELSFLTAVTLSELAKQGKPDKAWLYLHLMNGNNLKAGVFHQVAKAFIDEKKRLPDADSLLQVAVNTAAVSPEKESFIPPADLKNAFDGNMADFYNTYGMLRNLQGDVQGALTFQRLAVQYAKKRNSAINETLISYLRKAGRNQELIQEASAFLAAGNGTASTKKWLEEAFSYKERFRAYVDSLENIANTKMQRQLEFDMIKKKMPAFSLKGTDGNAINMESLKGKVVVLDFWATWCVPCKRSFPAMQMAVDRYKKDTNVVFLFVNTWESMLPEKRLPEILQFLQKSAYDFKVILDEPLGTKSRSYQLASALGVEGIPVKFIIDRNGDIRFMSLGFMGDGSRMLGELSNMIGIAMKQ